MRLKRVRIFGFKTFADRTEFSLEGGVIAVVGPNGCGKSNLVDAILWGLGEGNSRALRAQTGQDVIFSGSPRRKPVGFAEVTLLFDNEDRTLPIDAAEVSITRKLSRSGDSDYAINKRSCRLRDVYELLADSGLGRAGYAIVGQKEIDAALSASAEDRRGWVDEAAGVQRYRARKVESRRRLAQAAEHLERVNDIIRELDAQRGPLQREAEVAMRYRTVMASLRDVEIGLLVQDVSLAIQSLAEIEQRMEQAARVGQEERERAEKLEEEGRAIGQLISDIERELDTIRGLQQGALTALERADAQLLLLAQQTESLDAQERSLADDEAANTKRLTEAEAEVAHAREEETREHLAWDALRKELSGVGEEADRLNAALTALDKELEQARAAHARQLRLEAEFAQRKDRENAVRRELDGILASLPSLEEGIQEARLAFDAQTAGAQTQQDDLKAYERRLDELRKEDDRDAATVRKSMGERATLEGRKRGIEATLDAHEGLAQGPRAVLEAAERGLLNARYQAVGEAVEVDREFALAIETALGGSANDLICNDPQDAKTAIEWLKRNGAGRATFQPIPLMRPVEASMELRRVLSQRGVIGRASELIQTESRYRPVIDSLLGRVVIVETLDDALDLARTSGWSRMVTLDGEVVHSGGAVTGGRQSRQAYGAVQRRADLAELADQLAELEKSVGSYDRRVAERNRERREVEAARDEVKSQALLAQREIAEARGFLQSLLDEQKATLREKEKRQSELEILTRPAGEVEERVDVAGIEARRDLALKAMAGKSADAEQAESRLREAEILVRKATERREQSVRRLLSARESESVRLQRASRLGPERIRVAEEVAQSTQRKATAEADRDAAIMRLAQAQEKRRTMLEESLRIAELANAARNNAAAVADASHQAELDRARAESRKATAIARLGDEYSLTEAEALEQVGQFEVPEDAAAVVNRLRREVRSMGDVNLGAIEAYERLSGRYAELQAQCSDIQDGIDQVEAGIKELDKLTKDRFVSTFQAVEVEFAAAYQRLFGGGEGKIALTDPEDVLNTGIDLLLTLPGKRRQPLQLLSGGERSLAAMAFLFALLRVKPSPLVVLDEVDAPLDGRNVERFAEALKGLTDQTQFIVITHNQATILSAPTLLGVTMQEPGISVLLPAKLPDMESSSPTL